jgi:alpha-galactosidase/6-phospho-beta-glucosidase family protein
MVEPVARTSQAAHEDGIRTAGFSDGSSAAYAKVWKALHGPELAHPFETARSAVNLTCTGLDRLSWVVKVRGRPGNEDLYPVLRARVKEDSTLLEPLAGRLLRETGYLAACDEECLRGFFELPQKAPHPAFSPEYRGEGKEGGCRARVPDLPEYRGEGKDGQQQCLEQPLAAVAAMALGRAAEFDGVNLLNTGQIVSLSRYVFVETPAVAGPIPPTPLRTDLPSSVVPFCRDAAGLNEMIVRAARARSRHNLHEAIIMDSSIGDKHAARRAMDECLAAHADVLPRYE